MNLAISFALLLTSVSPAFAQIDAYTLKSKYGAPLDRETFTIRPGIEMVVDYGPGKQACRIQLPSGKQIVGDVPPGVVTKQQMDQVLAEVVPMAIRGKELYGVFTATGAPSLLTLEYEHVIISESKIGVIGNGIVVTFKDPACQKQQ